MKNQMNNIPEIDYLETLEKNFLNEFDAVLPTEEIFEDKVLKKEIEKLDKNKNIYFKDEIDIFDRVKGLEYELFKYANTTDKVSWDVKKENLRNLINYILLYDKIDKNIEDSVQYFLDKNQIKNSLIDIFIEYTLEKSLLFVILQVYSEHSFDMEEIFYNTSHQNIIKNLEKFRFLIINTDKNLNYIEKNLINEIKDRIDLIKQTLDFYPYLTLYFDEFREIKFNEEYYEGGVDVLEEERKTPMNLGLDLDALFRDKGTINNYIQYDSMYIFHAMWREVFLTVFSKYDEKNSFFHDLYLFSSNQFYTNFFFVLEPYTNFWKMLDLKNFSYFASDYLKFLSQVSPSFEEIIKYFKNYLNDSEYFIYYKSTKELDFIQTLEFFGDLHFSLVNDLYALAEESMYDQNRFLGYYHLLTLSIPSAGNLYYALINYVISRKNKIDKDFLYFISFYNKYLVEGAKNYFKEETRKEVSLIIKKLESLIELMVERSEKESKMKLDTFSKFMLKESLLGYIINFMYNSYIYKIIESSDNIPKEKQIKYIYELIGKGSIIKNILFTKFAINCILSSKKKRNK